MRPIFPHQQQMLDRFLESVSMERVPLAVILGGSITKGWHNEHSDVDVMVVVTDEELEERRSSGTLAVWDEEPADYPGGAVDIKYINTTYLELAATKANEPTRAAFVGASVVFRGASEFPFEQTLGRITRYPEDGVEDRISSYLAQVETMRWYISQADKRADPYLASWTASRAVLFGCRTVLAHNRVLYPFHKWLFRAVEECSDRPKDLTTLARVAVESPRLREVESFCDAVLGWLDRGSDQLPWAELYIRDTEWAWMNGPVSLEDG